MGCFDVCLEKQEGSCRGEAGTRLLGQGPGSPHGSRMGYVPWIISCTLLQLNPGAQG